MRRILATTLTAAALLGAGAVAATAVAAVPGVTRTSISVSAHSATQCDVTLAWTPNPYVDVDHYDVRFATSQSGLAGAETAVVKGLETRRLVTKGNGAWFALTPVLKDGAHAITVDRAVAAVAC
jgi:hypothetical protein